MNRLKLFNYDALNDSDFPEYQIDGIEQHLLKPRLLFADETGLGKTVQILGLLAALAQVGQLPTTFKGRALVAMPASLLAQWKSQIERFLPSITVQVITPEALNKKDRRPPTEYPQIELVSYDTLKSENYVHGFRAKAYSTVILDEAAALKAKGLRHDAVMDVASKARRVYVVSATLLENHPMELYALLTALRVPGLPPNKREWSKRFVVWEEGYSFERAGRTIFVDPKPIGLQPDAVDDLRRMMAPYTLRRTADEVGLEMPEVRPRVVLVQLGVAQQAAYDAGLRIWNAGQRHAALEKACERAGDDSAKIDWLVPWVTARPGKKVVVMAEHVEFLKLVQARFEAEGIGSLVLDGSVAHKDRAGVIDTFRDDPGIQVLLGSEVLERGIDGLQHITDTLIIIGSSYNPASINQAVGRLKRFGCSFDEIHLIMVIANVEHERSKLSKLDAKSSTAALLFDETPAVFGDLLSCAELIDDFVAVNDGWSAEDVDHLLGDPSKTFDELHDELLGLLSSQSLAQPDPL